MSAPVLDADDRIGLVLAIPPLRAMTIRGIPSAAMPLLRDVGQLRNQVEPASRGLPPRVTDTVLRLRCLSGV